MQTAFEITDIFTPEEIATLGAPAHYAFDAARRHYPQRDGESPDDRELRRTLVRAYAHAVLGGAAYQRPEHDRDQTTSGPRAVIAAPAQDATTAEPIADAPHLTDLGNAKRLVARHGHDLRYCDARGGWVVWDEVRWARDTTGEVMRRAKETVLALYAEAPLIADDEARKRFVNWARQSESAKHLDAMLKLAASEPEIAVAADLWDAHPWLLNVLNGTLDLRTGTLLPHDRQTLLTKLAPVVYEPEATHPIWEKFLHDATGGDPGLIAFLQRFVGYTLTGITSEEKLVFLHGPEATGKSTFIESMKATLGDYALTSDFETFLKRPATGSARNDLARLAGARCVVSIEVEDGKTLAEGVVKTLTGGDTVTARFFYKEFFEFVPQFKLWLAANDAPKLRDNDGAMWRRILRVPFEHTVPAAERDPRVKATLKNTTEAGAAILAWAVQGCLAWQQHGLGVPPSVEQATAAYREAMDPLRDFIDECCVVAENAWVTVARLRQAYERWTKESGEKSLITGREFSKRLTDRGFPAKRGTGGAWGRRGLGLREDHLREDGSDGSDGHSENFPHESPFEENCREDRHYRHSRHSDGHGADDEEVFE